jgi:hypothetical protein
MSEQMDSRIAVRDLDRTQPEAVAPEKVAPGTIGPGSKVTRSRLPTQPTEAKRSTAISTRRQ